VTTNFRRKTSPRPFGSFGRVYGKRSRTAQDRLRAFEMKAAIDGTGRGGGSRLLALSLPKGKVEGAFVYARALVRV